MNQERVFWADVVVIGGGTAGFGAALAAARLGASVRLIEASSKVGGVMASCPGMPWGGGYPLDRNIGGIFGDLVARLEANSPPASEKRPCALENFGPEVLYDHDVATLTMFEMLEEAGVIVHLGTIAGEPVVNDKRISGISCFDRLGAMRVDASMVIDCSGDGDISAKAGVPYTLGDSRGNMMAVTLSFHMIGAPWDVVFAEGDPYFERHARIGIEQNRLHPDLKKLYLMKGFHRDTVFCNTVTIRGVNGTDPMDVGRATQEGRRRCQQVARFLTESVPGFENAVMWNMGPTVGVRETRKLQAQYRITASDLARGTKFADGIVACDNPVDDVMREAAEMTHDRAVASGDYYTIPFRSLVPETIENLLFAGRLVCADPIAFASVRGMPQCMVMGQAAGTAASLALADDVSVQEIDARILVSRLVSNGVRGIGGTQL